MLCRLLYVDKYGLYTILLNVHVIQMIAWKRVWLVLGTAWNIQSDTIERIMMIEWMTLSFINISILDWTTLSLTKRPCPSIRCTTRLTRSLRSHIIIVTNQVVVRYGRYALYWSPIKQKQNCFVYVKIIHHIMFNLWFPYIFADCFSLECS